MTEAFPFGYDCGKSHACTAPELLLDEAALLLDEAELLDDAAEVLLLDDATLLLEDAEVLLEDAAEVLLDNVVALPLDAAEVLLDVLAPPALAVELAPPALAVEPTLLVVGAPPPPLGLPELAPLSVPPPPLLGVVEPQPTVLPAAANNATPAQTPLSLIRSPYRWRPPAVTRTGDSFLRLPRGRRKSLLRRLARVRWRRKFPAPRDGGERSMTLILRGSLSL